LDEGLSDPGSGEVATAEDAVLLEEVKIGCTLGMLTCLDRPHRLAYILGEILEIDGPAAAEILGISPAAFRKRLSRARTSVVEFTRKKCGLVD
jgi:DNA-directed RNA polymerase specialized sigma24 family protein